MDRNEALRLPLAEAHSGGEGYVTVVVTTAYGWMRSALRRADLWAGTRQGRSVFALLVLAWAVRLLLAPFVQLFGDQQVYIYWGAMMRHHFFDFYSYGALNPDWHFVPQYPPLGMYIVCITDSMYVAFSHLLGHSSQHALIAIMKGPAILADLGATALIYWLGRQVLTHRSALICAAVYAFQPAALVDGALWGQTDAIIVLAMLAALLLLVRRHVLWAGVVIGLGIMFKPQPVMLLPLMMVYAFRWQGWRAALRLLLGLGGSALAVWLPYLLPPHPQILVWRQVVSTTVDAWPATSPTAYNLWVLLHVDTADYRMPLFGPFTTSQVGTALFAVVVLILLTGILRDASPARLLMAAGITAVAFFSLTALQHERYLFPAVVLLLVAAMYERASLLFFIGVSVTSFLNMVGPIIMRSTLGYFPIPGGHVTWVSLFAPHFEQYAYDIALANVVLLGSMVAAYIYAGVRGRRDHRASSDTALALAHSPDPVSCAPTAVLEEVNRAAV